MDICVLRDMCVLRGYVCVLGTWTRVWEHRCIYLEYVYTQGHVSWEHAYMCDVYLGTHAGDTDICVAGKCVLGNVGMPRGMCVCLGTWAVVCVSRGQWVLGTEGVVFCVFRDWWMLGSVDARIRGPWGQWVLESMALGSVGVGVHEPKGWWLQVSVGVWIHCSVVVGCQGQCVPGSVGAGVCVPQGCWVLGSVVVGSACPRFCGSVVHACQGWWVLMRVSPRISECWSWFVPGLVCPKISECRS